MKREIIIAGFGGQGVLTLGVLIANAAVLDGLNATWLPSYGPEMRGGTANCHCIISDEEIGSAVISRPDILVAFNEPSLKKFLPQLKLDGTLFFNSDLITEEIAKDGIRTVPVPVRTLAKRLGSLKVQNSVMLGRMNFLMGLVSDESIQDSINEKFKDKQDILDINRKALAMVV